MTKGFGELKRRQQTEIEKKKTETESEILGDRCGKTAERKDEGLHAKEMLHNVISLSAASLSHSGEKSLRSE
jgi:hypothetical protein